MVTELSNNSNSFQNSFTAQLFTLSGNFKSDDVIYVTIDDLVAFKLHSKSDYTLYIHIYEMGPCWHIKSIVRGEYHVLLF